jgi:hypothetical protein
LLSQKTTFFDPGGHPNHSGSPSDLIGLIADWVGVSQWVLEDTVLGT